MSRIINFNNFFFKIQLPYNNIFFVIILLLRFDSSSAQCASPLFTESGLAFGYSKENVSTTFRGDLDIFPFTGIIHLNWVEMDTGSFPANHTLYMNAVYLDNELRVFTTEQMDNYEANEILRDPAILIHLSCNDSSTLGFRYKVTFLQENHHRPIFNEIAYDFKIPTPVFSGFELTTFEGNDIYVTDIDLYYNNITFTINSIDNNNLVEIRSRMNYDYRKRTYAAIVLTQQLLTIHEPLTFNITATDNSPIDPFTTVVQLTITSDENNKFLPPPKFEQLIYYGTLNPGEDENADRTFNLEPIILDAETFNNMDITFVKENDNENYFALTINENRITVSITAALEQLDLTRIFYLTFQINAIASGTDESGSTVIIINILRDMEEIISIPQFSDTIYHGQIDRNLQFTITEEIRLNEMITANDIDVFLEGDGSQWFTIDHDNEFSITINIRDELTISELENQPYFVFTIIASKPNALENGSAIILIHTLNIMDPNAVPQFEQPYYVTVLDNNLALAPFTISIIPSTYSEDVEIDMDGDPDELFTIVYNENQIEISAQLTEEDVEGYFQFILTFMARNPNVMGNSTTVLLINKPIIELIAIPLFEQSIYEGFLNELNSIILYSDISLTSDTYGSDIEFSIESSSEMIFITTQLNLVVLNLNETFILEELPIDQLYLTCKIIATRFSSSSGSGNSNTESTGFALVIIRLPSRMEPIELIPIPKFEKFIYKGSLSNQIDNELTHEDIRLLFWEEMNLYQIVFLLSDGDADSFDITNDQNQIQINLKSDITFEQFENRSYLICTIIANVINEDILEDNKGIAFLVVDIPDRNDIVNVSNVNYFEKRYYVGLIHRDLTVIESIESIDLSLLDSELLSLLSYQFDNSDDSEYFNFEINDVDNTIEITLKSPLLLSDIRDRIHFTFILQATNLENQATDKAVIIVQVPEKLCDGDQLEFENDYYSFWIMQGELKEFGKVTAKHTIGSVSYGLINPNEYLQSKITINENDGALMVIDTIMIGIYYFDVTVEDSEITARTSVKLEVMENLQCFTSNDTVDNIMIIKQIDEESITDVFQTTFNDYCSYQIQGMNPSDSEYVFKNPLTNQLQTIAIDRESNAFNNMAVPQIQVILKLFCGDEVITLPPPPPPPLIDNEVDNEDDLDEIDQSTIDYDEDIEETTVSSTGDDLQTTTTVVVDTEQTEDQTVDTQTPELDIELDITTTIEQQQQTTDIVIDENVENENVENEDVENQDVENENIENQDVENEDVENADIENQDLENQIVENPIVVDDQPENENVDNKNHDIVKRNIEHRKIKSMSERFNRMNVIPKSIEPGYDNRWYILTDDIAYRNDLTILTIILKDINDNAPEFIHPPYDQYLIGFPEPHIVERILPPYLMKCDAIDTDFGVNAEIRYQLNVNNHFEIDATNGIIIPIENAMAHIEGTDRIELNVVAIDMAGQSNGLRTSRSISVVKLQPKHITILTVKENENENNSDRLVEFLRGQTNDNIMLLHSSFIPTHSATAKKFKHPHPHDHHPHEHDHVDNIPDIHHAGKSQSNLRANGQYTVLRMVLYAFNTNGELIETEDLQRKLRAVNAEYDIASYHEALGPPVTAFDDIVMIIVIAVLSVVFVVTAIGAFLMWWFLIRPYEYRKILESNDSGSNGTSISDLKKVVDDGSPSPPERTMKSSFNDNRDSFNISGITDQENNVVKKFNDNNNFNIYNNNNTDTHFEDDFGEITREINKMKEDEKLERDRRAQTVTFNEMVERIDIETTVRESDDEIRI